MRPRILTNRICKANEKIEKKVDNYIIALLQQRGRCTQEDEPERKTRVDFLRYEYKLKNSFEMHLSSRRIVNIEWMEKQCVVGRSPIHLFHGNIPSSMAKNKLRKFWNRRWEILFPQITNYFDHLSSLSSSMDGLWIFQCVRPPSRPDLKSTDILHYIPQSSLFLALTWSSVCTFCWSSFVIYLLFPFFASSPPPHLQ